MPLSPDFESIKHQTILGHDYWSARELMPLLGYGNKWQNFEKVVEKAISAAQEAELALADHFTGVSKIIEVGKGGKREVKDYFLSKRACFLIAQNGDSRKAEIAAAQNFFAFTA
ncbi:MAG TPA: BRO family protein, partial [Ktedonobacteraceae bacterium]|nr:BRO family protein [Ktedonobacteraceae bacterium]